MNIFEQIQIKRAKRNTFDKSHEKKLSCKMGDLIPIYHEEIIPGDSFQVSSEIMLRLAPMLAPVMHRVHVYTHYFFVPNRLIWDEWEDFITGGVDGTAQPEWPHFEVTDAAAPLYFSQGSLADYLGFPDFDLIQNIVDPIKISALPFRAYMKIWEEYYRDQNLEVPPLWNPISGKDTRYSALCTIRKRAWEKDYFTSALPWAQRGDEVSMPFEPVYKQTSEVYDSGGGNPTGTDPLSSATDALLRIRPGQTGRIENLESGAGVTINDLRTATRLQRWLERNARGGSRYIEQIMSHFGVKSSDARLQRPEYLGGGRQPVTISEVVSTVSQTAAGAEAPQGELTGHGVSVGRTNRFKKYFEEHGHVLGIMSVLPKTAYQQGIPRKFTRTDKTEYFWTEFAHLGEQEIKKKELYVQGNDALNEQTFGYTPRYAEYKYECDTVHGDFKGNLDFWHMGRKFTNQPNLNAQFVNSDPTDRIFAVQDGTDNLWVQIYNKVIAKRQMPYFGTPRL